MHHHRLQMSDRKAFCRNLRGACSDGESSCCGTAGAVQEALASTAVDTRLETIVTTGGTLTAAHSMVSMQRARGLDAAVTMQAFALAGTPARTQQGAARPEFRVGLDNTPLQCAQQQGRQPTWAADPASGNPVDPGSRMSCAAHAVANSRRLQRSLVAIGAGSRRLADPTGRCGRGKGATARVG